MAQTFDRLKNSLFALVRAAVPRVVYASPRIARVVSAATASDGSTTLDVAPEDPDFPSMSRVPLFHGLPGVVLTLATGTRVVVEFSEADPARGFVRSWAGGEVVLSMTLSGTRVTIGGDALAEPPIKGLTFQAALLAFLEALNTYVLGIKPVVDVTNILTPAMTAAIQAFGTSIASALATNSAVK